MKAENKTPISKILRERQLNPKLFNEVPPLSASISKHVNWAFQIYSRPYPGENKKNLAGIARMYHGIQHATRVSIYVLVWANLYRLFGNEESLKLTDEDIKLAQVGAVLHDIARLNDGTDMWDYESGVFTGEYLINLGVPVDKAQLIADAVANKDRYPPANIFQALLQNADCLDIKRVRTIFQATFLFFFKEIASQNKTAFLLMAKLIIEVYGLIVQQGDYFKQLDPAKKKKYENGNAYRLIMNDILAGCPDPLASFFQNDEKTILTTYPILKKLSQGLLDPSVLENLPSQLLATSCPLTRKMNQGNIFFRGVVNPSGLALEKKIKSPNGKHTLTIQESRAGIEVRKASRREGIETRSGSRKKHGNPGRSLTLLMWGAPTLFNTGYLIFGLNFIQAIEVKNIFSGYGKKLAWTQSPTYLNPEEQKEKKKVLRKSQQMGGTLTSSDTIHNEVIGCITEFHGVMYTLDILSTTVKDFAHPLVPIVQAIFLQYEYYRQNKILLEIYEYWAVHNTMKKRTFTEEQITTIWRTLCVRYMEHLAQNTHTLYKLLESPIESILNNSLYEENECTINPIHNYPESLIHKIQESVLNEKKIILREIKNEIRKRLMEHTCEELVKILSGRDLFSLYHLGLLKERPIRIKILELINSADLFQLTGEINFNLLYQHSSHTDLDNYLILIKNSRPLTLLIEDKRITEPEKKLCVLFHIAGFLKMPKIIQEIQNIVLKICFLSLDSYLEDIREKMPLAPIVSLYLASCFGINKNEELLNKIQGYIRKGIEYSKIFGERFENKFYSGAMGRRRDEISSLSETLKLLLHFAYPPQKEITLLFETWASLYPTVQRKKADLFQRYPQFAGVYTWPENVQNSRQYKILEAKFIPAFKKEFHEILLYFFIVADTLIFLRANPSLQIEEKGEETHYQKLLDCMVTEIVKQMPKQEETSVEDIIHFFDRAHPLMLNHEGLFLKLLQHIKISNPPLFKPYLEAILKVTGKKYLDQFKEIETFLCSHSTPDAGVFSPALLIQYSEVGLEPSTRARHRLFSEIKPSAVIQILEQAQLAQKIPEKQKEKERCRIS